MKTATVLLLLAGLGCEAFAYWGIKTIPGRRAFDEMAGMIPLAAVPAGILLMLAGAFLWWRSRGVRP